MQSANDRFVDYSERTSTATRALVLSIIAVCWLFLRDVATPIGSKEAANPTTALEAAHAAPLLTAAIGLSVLALVFDLGQYAYGAIRYYRFATTAEIVLGRESGNRTAEEVSKAWGRAANNGLLYTILASSGALTTELTSKRADAIAKGREVVEALHSYEAGPEAYERRTGTKPFSASRLKDLSDTLAKPWSPRSMVTFTVWLFRLKLAAALVAGVLLCIFAVRVVLADAPPSEPANSDVPGTAIEVPCLPAGDQNSPTPRPQSARSYSQLQ